jgi:hypothetical protein
MHLWCRLLPQATSHWTCCDHHDAIHKSPPMPS